MSVAHLTDKFDAETLPDPELNPLLNPLLAANMGRWAEVYFTNPPEKRGQAVSDLLRELKKDSHLESASVQVINEQNGEKETPTADAQQPSPAAVESQRTCRVCSANNSGDHKFCGMCGALLQSSPQTDKAKFYETELTSKAHWSEEYVAPPAFGATGYVRDDASESGWPIPETDLPHFAQESESAPYRYRLYIGVVVAVLLGGLLYMAWHRTPGSSGDVSESAPSRVIPAAPPSVAVSPAQQPAATRTVLPADRSPADRPPADRPPDLSSTTAAQSQNQPEASSPKDRVPNARAGPSQRIGTVATNSFAGPTEQGGAEDLATAEKYLNSSHGMARDNREAAQWLWKAVGKGNLAATMTLSDLYLRGDGIPKSCDQARLLLDAAARKGKAAAAQRLRNLQAFGCQ
jgi:hypothetical protein